MDPGVREALEKASSFCDEERDEDAERVILKALEVYPNNLDLRTMLGKIQSKERKLKDLMEK